MPFGKILHTCSPKLLSLLLVKTVNIMCHHYVFCLFNVDFVRPVDVVYPHDDFKTNISLGDLEAKLLNEFSSLHI